MISARDLVLLPQPRKITARPGSVATGDIKQIVVRGNPAEALGAALQLQAAGRHYAGVNWTVRAGDASPDGAVSAVLELAPRAGLPAQGYRLSVTPRGVHLIASDAAGLFYGVMTLKQVLRQTGAALPACTMEDQPDFPSRGVMLDVSRDKVPTLETLFTLVEQLAEWKLNHLELYTEHTFAYRRHPEVWAEASPLTGEDILRLDAHCRAHHVELVPNQNSFGHMERWLKLPAYHELAESPDGYDTPWGTRSAHPSCLNPSDPRSLHLMAELHDELLAHFTSRKFNVGCDETWELGQGKSKALCAQRGHGRVYLDFLLKLHKLVRRQGRTMHFWGDIIIKHPELVAELPRDIVVLEWGYEANHPFGEHGAKFAATGLPFYVCPGTSSWNAISGRTENSLENLRNAAENGLRQGAVGFLNTDWGDNGHWQYLPVSYLGFASGAALSWCVKTNREADIRPALDRHVFEDAAGEMGHLAYDLGNAYLKAGHLPGNSSVIFHLLSNDTNWPIPKTVTVKTLGATRDFVETTAGRLGRARMNRPDATLVTDEFANVARLLVHACVRGQWRLKPPAKAGAVKAALAGDLRVILGEHRRLWMARNRPGGLQDSARRLETRLTDYA